MPQNMPHPCYKIKLFWRSPLGPDYFDRLEAARIEYHHVRRLEQLGYTVTLTPKEVA